VIEHCLDLIQRKADKIPKKVLIFSSHFFNVLASDTNVFDYDRVIGCTKAKNMRADCPNLFTYHVLIIPVNHQNSHWFLVKVDFVERTIRVYDSLVSTDAEQYLDWTRRYLREEAIHATHCTLEELWSEGWDVGVEPNVPRQDNSTDCGLFMLSFAECIAFDLNFFIDASSVAHYRFRVGVDIMTNDLYS